MSDVTKPPEAPHEPEGPNDSIARLLRVAGPRPTVPEERLERVRQTVHAEWREAVLRERRRRWMVIGLPSAAALLLLVGAGIWLRTERGVAPITVAVIERTEGHIQLCCGAAASTGSDAAPGSALPAGAEVLSGPAARAALRLAGGPSVRLDSDTGLRLISARVLELQRGAIYVDTGAQPSVDAALEVRTDLGRIRDVGTQFEVRLANDGLDVRVREGVAALQRDHRSYAASAGTRLRVDQGGTVESHSIGPEEAVWDWVQTIAPPFDLEGRTLGDYLDWLSRETGWSVGYADPSIAPSLATVILHGSTSGLRPDQTPAAVLPTCGLRHRLDGRSLIIERDSGEGGAR